MLIRPLHSARLSFKLLILIAVGGSLALALLGSGLLIWPLWTSYRYTNEVVALDGALREVTVALARERGLVATALAADDPASADLLADIHAAREVAKTALDETLSSLAESAPGSGLKNRLQKVQLLRDRVMDLRQEADISIRHPVSGRNAGLRATWTIALTALIEICQDMRLAAMRSTRAADTTFEDLQMLQHFAWSAAEHAGRERAMTGALVSSGSAIDEASLQELLHNRGEIVFAWEMAVLLAEMSNEAPELQRTARIATSRFFVEFEQLRRDVVFAGRRGLPYPVDAEAWIAASTVAIDSLLAVEGAASQAATRHRDRAFLRAFSAIVVSAGLFVVISVTAAFSLFLFKRRISDPLRGIVQATRRFARGDYGGDIPGLLGDREVAEMAVAIGEFRDDAVERARLKAELRVARDKAEAASRAKTEFLANMSHELKTPLNAVIGFSELIKSEAFGPLGHGKYLEYAGNVQESGRQLLGLINDVLDMARIEARQSTLREEVVDLVEIAALGVRRIEDQARCRGLSVETDWTGPLRVFGDAEKIDRVIVSLLSNAVKFTSAGGRIAVRVRRATDGSAVLEVEDTGIGMTASDRKMVYEPFYQIDSGLNRRHEGAGLGIPLSSAIAGMHGGQLEIDSEPGVGTKVRMILPPERCLD